MTALHIFQKSSFPLVVQAAFFCLNRVLPLSCDTVKNIYPVCDYTVENWYMPHLLSRDEGALGQKMKSYSELFNGYTSSSRLATREN